MKTSAKVIQDSTTHGARLTTLEITFPRFILAEFNTHRVFSRSFRSSRAVPVKKLLEEVRTHPFTPQNFLMNQPGMQASQNLSHMDGEQARMIWLRAAQTSASLAEELMDFGVHKQQANRLLEPFLYVVGVVTATELNNFFTLRDHQDAQPEFRELAVAIREAINDSTPIHRLSDPGLYLTGKHGSSRYGSNEQSWHLPYVTDEERAIYNVHTLTKLSAVRCARVSYRPHDNSDPLDMNKVNDTFTKLALSDPVHASPFEHQAAPGTHHEVKLSRNFDKSWWQYRSVLEFRIGMEEFSL